MDIRLKNGFTRLKLIYEYKNKLTSVKRDLSVQMDLQV